MTQVDNRSYFERVVGKMSPEDVNGLIKRCWINSDDNLGFAGMTLGDFIFVALLYHELTVIVHGTIFI